MQPPYEQNLTNAVSALIQEVHDFKDEVIGRLDRMEQAHRIDLVAVNRRLDDHISETLPIIAEFRQMQGQDKVINAVLWLLLGSTFTIIGAVVVNYLVRGITL